MNNKAVSLNDLKMALQCLKDYCCNNNNNPDINMVIDVSVVNEEMTISLKNSSSPIVFVNGEEMIIG